MANQYLYNIQFLNEETKEREEDNYWATDKRHAIYLFYKEHTKASVINCDLMANVVGVD